MRGLARHLTYANVVSTLALFLVVAGGVAYAANTVFSTDIVDGEVKSVDIANESITGTDVMNRSGVDTCNAGTRFASLCFRALNTANTWSGAIDACAALSMRVPSLGEAKLLAVKNDLPNVTEEDFWTEEFYSPGTDFRGWTMFDSGSSSNRQKDEFAETACVGTPFS